jgi:hypothetical protein
MDRSADLFAEQLATDSKGGGSVLGGSSMEYNQEAGPTKYLVGTEQGVIMQVYKTVIYSFMDTFSQRTECCFSIEKRYNNCCLPHVSIL